MSDLHILKYKATHTDMRQIRKAFEDMNPFAIQYRRSDRDDWEYWPPMREPFYAFRDGWLAARSVFSAGAKSDG